jgi:hypothetical protein
MITKIPPPDKNLVIVEYPSPTAIINAITSDINMLILLSKTFKVLNNPKSIVTTAKKGRKNENSILSGKIKFTMYI